MCKQNGDGDDGIKEGRGVWNTRGSGMLISVDIVYLS